MDVLSPLQNRSTQSSSSTSSSTAIPPLAPKRYMGCTQSGNAPDSMVLHPRDGRSAGLSASQSQSLQDAAPLMVAGSTSRVARSVHHRASPPLSGSGHRDVFSIFGERGMVLEASQVEVPTANSHSHTSPSFNPHHHTSSSSRSANSKNASCSPVSASGSVFSTATTASDTERTQVVRGPKDQCVAALQLTYGAYSDKGMRKLNEDRKICVARGTGDDTVAYFGIYDGHGGTTVADHLANHLHMAVFDRLDKKAGDMAGAIADAFAGTDDLIYQKQLESGSTALSLLVKGRRALVACVGDSQAVLSTNGVARALSAIHSPDDESEKERILAAKGVVVKGRIFGLLSVSRAFGDNDFKTSRGEYKKKFNGDLVSAIPDLVEFTIEQDDEFMVLGCDGLFEVMEPQQVVDFVRAKLALHGEVQHASEELVSYAISIGSTDNVSAIVVCFNQTVVAIEEEAADEEETDKHDGAASSSARE
jgi:protein phosphatase PTC2/3